MSYYFHNGQFLIESIHNIPNGAKKITDKQFNELIAARSSGKILKLDSGGEIYQEDPPIASVSNLLESVKTQIRPLRNSILTEVVQIALVAKAIGNDLLAAEVLTPETGLRDRLLDITDDQGLNSAQTREDMELAVMTYYRALVATVSPELRLAFKGLEK